MSSQQPLGATRAWSFDDTLQRQRHLSMRPGVLNRHSLDAGPGASPLIAHESPLVPWRMVRRRVHLGQARSRLVCGVRTSMAGVLWGCCVAVFQECLGRTQLCRNWPQ